VDGRGGRRAPVPRRDRHLLPGHDEKVLTGTDWNDYLILLGGPFAAGVLAKLTVVTKVENGQIQKTLTSAASGSALSPMASAASLAATSPPTDPGARAASPQAGNAITNDAGELDLVDTQYLVFNFVALIYVFGVFVSRIVDQAEKDNAIKFSLPHVPAVLLGLTSAAAATYVGNKAALKDPPLISTLNPVSPQANNLVEILGVNLLPSGSEQTITQVLVKQVTATALGTGSSFVLPAQAATATKVTFTMPSSIPSGDDVDLQVITTANVATPAYRAKVA